MKCGGSLVHVMKDVNIININVIKLKQLKKINTHFQILFFQFFSHSIFKKLPFSETVFYLDFIFLLVSSHLNKYISTSKNCSKLNLEKILNKRIKKINNFLFHNTQHFP